MCRRSMSGRTRLQTRKSAVSLTAPSEKMQPQGTLHLVVVSGPRFMFLIGPIRFNGLGDESGRVVAQFELKQVFRTAFQMR